MPRTHHLPDDQVHFLWDTGNEPVLVVDSGDTVVVWTRDVSDNQIGPDSDASVIAGLDWDRVYPLSGPIAVDGAEPGDTLEIEVLDIHTQGWGWTAVLPGLGLLPEDFPDAYLRIFDLSHGDVAYMREDIAIPLEPFFGTMGRVPGRRERAAGDAARLVRRKHGHPPARARVHAVSAGAGRAGAVLLWRCSRRPGRRRGLRDRARGADVRLAALHAREGSLDPGAAVPHAGPADAARGLGAVLCHDGRGRRSLRRRPGCRAGDGRAHRGHLRPRPRGRLPALQPRVDLKISEIVDAGQYIVSALLPEAIFSN